MRLATSEVEAVAQLEHENRMFVLSSAGEVWRWQKVRGDLVIDKPTEKEYDELTADESEQGEATRSS